MAASDDSSLEISGRTVARSAAWRLIESIGGEMIALALFIVMARLLLPAHFGVIALAGVVIAGMQVILGYGLADALVQGRQLDEVRLATAFWCNLGVALALMLLVMALAAPAAGLFAEPALAPLLATLALVLPINGAGAIYQARLLRRLAFKAMAIRTLCGNLAGGAAGLTLALAGAGAWALVAQQLTGMAAGLLVLMLADRWRPRLILDRAEAGALARFALPTTGTHLVKYAGKKLDIAILGLFVSAGSIGHYFLVTRLIVVVGLVSHYTIFGLSLPILSRLAATPKALAAAARQTLWLTAALSLPVGLGVALVADPLLPLIFGEAWRPSILPLQILASLSVFYGLGLIAGQILVAAGHPGRFFKLGLANTTLFLALVGLAAPHGLAAAALAGGLANALMLPAYLTVLAHTIGLDVGAVMREQMPIWGAALLMVVLVLPSELWLLVGLPPVPALLLAVAIGLASYATALWLMAGEMIRRLIESLKVRPAGSEQAQPLRETPADAGEPQASA